jgi:hypothetical protein
MAAPIGALRAEMSAGHAQFERDMGKARAAVQKNGRQMETAMNKVGASFTSTIKTIASIGAAYLAVNKAWDYAEQAAKYEQSRQAFNSMAEGMGADAEKVFERVRKLSGGLIDDNALIESMNKAISLGIPIEKLGDLMLIARAKSRDMGITTTQAFNDIATGIGRGSPLILDNLGLVMKVGTANEQMAASLGKTVQELTDKEKKMAILNATLDAGKEALSRHNLEVLTDKERMDSLGASTANLGIELGKLFKGPVSDVSSGLASIVKNINELIETNRKWKEEQSDPSTIIQNEIDLLGKKIAIHSKLAKVIPGRQEKVEEMALLREQLVLELENLSTLKKRAAAAAAEAAAEKRRAKEKSGADAAAAEAAEREKEARAKFATEQKRLGEEAILRARREVELYGEVSEADKVRWEIEKGRYADLLPEHQKLLLQYAEELDRLEALAEGNKAAMEKIGDSTEEAAARFEELKMVIDGWGKDSAAAIADFAMRGETSFRDMIDAMIRDLLRMAAYQNITRPLFGGISGAIGNLFGGGTTGPHIGAGGTTAFGMHGGGIAGQDSSFTRTLPGGLFSHAPRLHSGLMPDEFPAILQKGEAVIPKDAVGGGAGDTNVFIYAVDAKSFEDMCRRNPGAINSQVLQSLRDNKTRSEIKSLLR